MIAFTETSLPGAYLVDLVPSSDVRGFFARSYSAQEFAAQGLGPELRECSVSYNARKATLRGMHYQIAPHEEHKTSSWICVRRRVITAAGSAPRSMPTIAVPCSFRPVLRTGSSRWRTTARCCT